MIDRSFVLGNPNNPWWNIFPQFTDQIKELIGKSVFEMSLMDSMKTYVNYLLYAGCGIPEVKMLGTLEDWEHLKSLVQLIGQSYDLEFWTSKLLPIFDKFIEAY